MVFNHADKVCNFIIDDFQPSWSRVPACAIDGQTSNHANWKTCFWIGWKIGFFSWVIWLVQNHYPASGLGSTPGACMFYIYCWTSTSASTDQNASLGILNLTWIEISKNFGHKPDSFELANVNSVSQSSYLSANEVFLKCQSKISCEWYWTFSSVTHCFLVSILYT